MHRNLKIYSDEIERSHTAAGIVATIWTVLFVGMFAASLLGNQTKPVETANVGAVTGGALHP
jgi:hypothetical protein